MNISSINSLEYPTLEQLPLPKVEVLEQIRHSQEVLRKHSWLAALKPALAADMSDFVNDYVEASLPERYKHRADEITRAVIMAANEHSMDPLFLVAVIKTESRFNIKARGSHGEIGLMQILPQTAKGVARKIGFEGTVDLENPAINIKLGAAYMAQLRNQFNRVANHYISAYNMGPRNVRRLLASQKVPKIYFGRVRSNYSVIYKRLQVTMTDSADTKVAAR